MSHLKAHSSQYVSSEECYADTEVSMGTNEFVPSDRANALFEAVDDISLK